MRRRGWVVALVALGLFGTLVSCASGGDDASSEDGAASEGGSPAEPDDAGAEGGDDLALPTGEPIQAGRSIIATADVSIEVDDAREAAGRAGDVAAATGGFLAQQEARP